MRSWPLNDLAFQKVRVAIHQQLYLVVELPFVGGLSIAILVTRWGYSTHRTCS